ncbi:type 2 lactosamine alpha-2,3-sialyltransferase-like [Glandiceps talaboti]
MKLRRRRYRQLIFITLSLVSVSLFIVVQDEDVVYRRMAAAIGDGETLIHRVKEIIAGSSNSIVHPRPCERRYIQKRVNHVIESFDPNEALFINNSYNAERNEAFFSILKVMEVDDEGLVVIDKILEKLPNVKKRDRFGNNCKRCVVVGGSGVLRGQRLGPVIDSYDIVIRMNNAPVRHFSLDVGRKTSFRFLYPESAFHDNSEYSSDSDVVFVVYKRADLDWLYTMLTDSNPAALVKDKRFWQKVPSKFTKSRDKIRLLHPHIYTLTKRKHLNVPIKPSIGMITITFALHYCDHIDIAGFGHDPSLPFHYYSLRKIVMSSSFLAGHNWTAEEQHLTKLIKTGLIEKDLTGYIGKESTR